jgi:hypothetical protein
VQKLSVQKIHKQENLQTIQPDKKNSDQLKSKDSKEKVCKSKKEKTFKCTFFGCTKTFSEPCKLKRHNMSHTVSQKLLISVFRERGHSNVINAANNFLWNSTCRLTWECIQERDPMHATTQDADSSAVKFLVWKLTKQFITSTKRFILLKLKDENKS